MLRLLIHITMYKWRFKILVDDSKNLLVTRPLLILILTSLVKLVNHHWLSKISKSYKDSGEVVQCLRLRYAEFKVWNTNGHNGQYFTCWIKFIHINMCQLKSKKFSFLNIIIIFFFKVKITRSYFALIIACNF